MKKYFYIVVLAFCFANFSPQEKTATITTTQLKELLSKEKVQLLDVRTPEEVQQGFIKSARFANYLDYNFTVKTLKLINKSKPVYLYCRSGNRSGKACKILEEKGFTVINVLGGYTKWKKENNNETNRN
ncbi:rhodanese-like domain-containing protein [Polaribacter porphyrae]|uniref:Rhodanese-like domain-containing protein n=1 Tax=Polaribacter porphyrae TaxID=1137780 RepID=A0A2S7WRX9_9FLAO|nr:rhodanese-like domain-containing protein [Polaribacter porphyrae]PQJ80344.1 rhodanese-like domain-containing protein [Polaribacter porphyrae]